jgi:tripartite-type tricarboxylate transporter receptor subunit TctC
MTIWVRAWLFAVPAVAFAVALCGASAGAQDAETFYRAHNKLTLAAPSNTGGGYDTYTRLLGRHMPAHVPGNPTAVVQNIPAAGGMQVANVVYNTAVKDGTYLGLVRGTVVQEHIYGNTAALFDGRKFGWIGNMNVDYDGCIMWAASGVTSIKNFYTREVIVGASGAGAQSYSFPIVYNEILGTKFKVISGYPGTPERVLAMERGELTGACGITTSTLRATLDQPFKEGKILLIAQAGGEKDPTFPDVPNLLDEAKTPEARQSLLFLFGTLDLGRPFAVAPEVPADRVALLQRAFVESMQDPALVEDAKKLQVDIDFMDGARTRAAVDRLYATPKPAIDRLQAALAKKAG